MPQRRGVDSSPKPVPSPKSKKDMNSSKGGPIPMDQSKPGKTGNHSNQNESQFNMGKALIIERPQNGINAPFFDKPEVISFHTGSNYY